MNNKKKMIRVKCFAGLGNQLFQYACGRAIKEKYGGELYIDISNFKKDKRDFELNNYKLNKDVKFIENDKTFTNLINNIPLKIMCKVAPKIMFKIGSKFGKYLYLGDEYVKINKNFTKNYYLYGYWQSEAYFKDIKDILQDKFILKTELKQSHKDICSKKYYDEAIQIINDKVKNPIFYVFSDDIEYVKENWKFGNNFKFIDEKNENYEDINLMRYCKHYIIANSSFSWWGQYLSENSNKIVIAPKKWYNKNNKVDIYMENWITI